MSFTGYGTGQDRLQHRADINTSGFRSKTVAESSKVSEKEPENDDNYGAVCRCDDSHYNSDCCEILAFHVSAVSAYVMSGIKYQLALSSARQCSVTLPLLQRQTGRSLCRCWSLPGMWQFTKVLVYTL